MSVKISNLSSAFSVLFPKTNVPFLLDVEELASTFCRFVQDTTMAFEALHMEALILLCTTLCLSYHGEGVAFDFLV